MAPVCDACLESLQNGRLGPCCAVCSEPLGFEPVYALAEAERCCGVCAAEPRPFVRATAFASYDGVQHALQMFKFQHVESLAAPLGLLLAEAIATHAEDLPGVLLVIPVPLFGRRRRLYNQSALLARKALPVVRRMRPATRFVLQARAMRRVHQKTTQYRLSPEERRENVRGAFRVRSDVRGKHVLLVDDVYTTGATVSECAQMLLQAGAASVRVATLARAGHDMTGRWTETAAVLAKTTPAQQLWDEM